MADFPSPPQWLRGLAAKIAASTVVPDKGAVVTSDDGRIRIGDGTTQLKNLPYVANSADLISYVSAVSSTPAADGGVLARANIGVGSPSSPAQGRPVPGCVGDNTADDTTPLAAALSSLQSGAVMDLGGLAYKTTAPLTLSKAVVLRNGTINAGNHNALTITGSGVVLDKGLKLTRGTGSGVLDTLAQKALVSATAPFVSDGVAYSGTAHSCVYLAHALCNGTTIRHGSMVNNTAAQDSAGVYVAAGATGNLDITVDAVSISGACADGVLIFDSQRCRVSGCRINGMAILPTVTLAGWTLVTGNIYKQRTASGTPGSTGVSTDRADGNTRVVKQAGTQLVESGTPTTPGTNTWGESGGFVYINLGGTDPNTVTITSDIVSGYGVTFYSTANGFTTVSANLVDGNQIHDVDGFGIYMQLSNYSNTCVDNKTAFNTLTNVCLKGSQSTTLPFAGIAWNGGLNCLSIGDHIDTVGTVSLTVPGFYASDAGVPCRGRAIGVVVANSLAAEGFRCNDASEWSYIGCTATGNATSGFKGQLNPSRVVTGLQFLGCTATGNALAGLSLDASQSGAVCSAVIIGGDYYSNTQQGIILNTVRNTFVDGAITHDNGSTSFPQLRFVGDCKNSGVDNIVMYHSLAGASFQLAASQSTAFSYGSVSIPSNMAAANMGSNIVKVSGGSGVPSVYTGSGAPGIAGVLGDRYERSDTPSTANQRTYICTTAGAAGVAVWTGIL